MASLAIKIKNYVKSVKSTLAAQLISINIKCLVQNISVSLLYSSEAPASPVVLSELPCHHYEDPSKLWGEMLDETACHYYENSSKLQEEEVIYDEVVEQPRTGSMYKFTTCTAYY